MKVHANAPLGPKGRETMVLAGVEQGWSLAEAAEAAGVSERTCSKWVARYRAEGEAGLLDRSSAPQVDPAPHAGRARRGDRARCGRLRMTGAEIAFCLAMALSTVSAVLAAGRAGQALHGSSRPSRRTATSAGTPASCSTSTSRSSAGSPRRRRPPRHTASAAAAQPPPTPPAERHRRLGVRARLRRRRHPPGLRRGPRRREGDHRGRVPAPRDRVLPPPRHHRRARDDRQRRLPTARPSTPSPAARSASATCAPGPTGRAPTARPSASSAPCSPAGPTARSTAQAENAPQPLTAGSGPTTIAAHTAPSATSRPIARLNELNNLAGSYS